MKCFWANICLLGYLLFFTTSCTTVPTLTNFTPQVIPENQSRIYSVSMVLEEGQTLRADQKAQVVIGGEVYDMVPIPALEGHYVFDYAMPAGQNLARYYFQVANESGDSLSKSEIHEFRLTNRYILELSSQRGRPGQQISVLGKGFTDTDTILFSGIEVPTRYTSESQLVFDVPAMAAGSDYELTLRTPGGLLEAGIFRIDFSQLRVVPFRLQLVQGQSAVVVFSIDHDAPTGGVPLSLSSTVWDVVRFGEAIIPENSRSTNIEIEGNTPGITTIIAQAEGHNEVEIDVEVIDRLVDDSGSGLQ